MSIFSDPTRHFRILKRQTDKWAKWPDWSRSVWQTSPRRGSTHCACGRHWSIWSRRWEKKIPPHRPLKCQSDEYYPNPLSLSPKNHPPHPFKLIPHQQQKLTWVKVHTFVEFRWSIYYIAVYLSSYHFLVFFYHFIITMNTHSVQTVRCMQVSLLFSHSLTTPPPPVQVQSHTHYTSSCHIFTGLSLSLSLPK